MRLSFRARLTVMLGEEDVEGGEGTLRLSTPLIDEQGRNRFDRGRYSTDASHYQIMPLGVVTPRTIEEAERAIGICRAEGVAVTARVPAGSVRVSWPSRVSLKR